MNLQKLLQDSKFNAIFSLLVGIGIVCIIHPVCAGKDCEPIKKPPSEKDFDKYAYRMGNNVCYEFKTEVVDCPASGCIEAFESTSSSHATRRTPIKRD